MPKPPNAQKPKTWVEGERIPADQFTHAYWCPACLSIVPSIAQVSRPPIWHEACKPERSDQETRRKRICPGCGLMHVIPPATSSSYCNELCKVRYKLSVGVVKPPNRPCVICGEPSAPHRLARRLHLCSTHYLAVNTLTGIRTADRNEPVYSNFTAIEAIKDGTLPDDHARMLTNLNPATPRTTQAQAEEARGLYIPPSTIYPVDDDEVDWS